ncbi:MAG: hypothetical protein ACJ8F1_14590 [Polyangia bacterium]
MKRLALIALIVLATGSGQLGCGSNPLSGGGSGGAIAAGGAIGAGGGFGFGGLRLPAGGNSGTGAGGIPGTGGAEAGDIRLGFGASCSGYVGAGGSPPAWDGGLPSDGADAAAPVMGCDVLPEDQATFPWIIEPKGKVAGPTGAGGTTGVGGGSGSGCQSTFGQSSYQDVVCTGAAWLRPTGGVGGAGGNVPSLTWDDGSKMSWEPHALDPAIPAPITQGSPDQRVWAELQIHVTTQSGPFVTIGPALWGQPAIQVLTVRDSQNGPIRFIAQQGTGLADPTVEQLTALFGVTAHSVPVCSFEQRDSQYDMRFTLDDHVLETTPTQLIRYGVGTEVRSPFGIFAVVWYRRDQQIAAAYCGPGARDTQTVGFVASRTASP